MSNSAVSLARDYFAAWTSQDVDKAAAYLAGDVEIVGPNGSFSGHAGYHQFMDNFARMLTSVDDFTVYGDDTTALVWYAAHLKPVPTLIGTERLTVTAGKISRLEVNFDTAPMRAARP